MSWQSRYTSKLSLQVWLLAFFFLSGHQKTFRCLNTSRDQIPFSLSPHPLACFSVLARFSSLAADFLWTPMDRPRMKPPLGALLLIPLLIVGAASDFLRDWEGVSGRRSYRFLIVISLDTYLLNFIRIISKRIIGDLFYPLKVTIIVFLTLRF